MLCVRETPTGGDYEVGDLQNCVIFKERDRLYLSALEATAVRCVRVDYCRFLICGGRKEHEKTLFYGSFDELDIGSHCVEGMHFYMCRGEMC